MLLGGRGWPTPSAAQTFPPEGGSGRRGSHFRPHGAAPGRSAAVRRRARSYKSRGPSNGVTFAPHRVRGRHRDRRLDSPLDPGGFMALSFRRFVGRVAVGVLAVAVPVVHDAGGGVRGHTHRPVLLGVRRGVEQQQGPRDLQRHGCGGRPRRRAGTSCRCTPTGPTVEHSTISLTGVRDQPATSGSSRTPSARTPPSWAAPTADLRRRSASTATTPWCCARAGRGRRSSTSSARWALDPGTEWGSGSDQHRRQHAPPQGRRSSAGDATIDDAFDPAAQWDGFATDTFDGLGAHPGLPADPRPR